MTRINIIPPSELHDQHLVAEIREINQLASHFNNSMKSKSGFIVPPRYTLNKGHVTFFYNKGKYLHKRFDALKKEAIEHRRFNIQTTFNNQWVNHPTYYNDWTPEQDDFPIIRERINDRINAKPTFYRKTRYE